MITVAENYSTNMTKVNTKNQENESVVEGLTLQIGCKHLPISLLQCMYESGSIVINL